MSAPFRKFCLTLPETPERQAKAKAHFQEMRVYDVEWFYGVHAEKFGIQTHFTYEVDNPGTGFRIGFKPTGIWLSHYMLWAALNLLWDDHFLILEDDAKFPSDWHPRFVEALKDTPKDFDMLYMGSCCCKGRPQKHIAGNVYECKAMNCTHAYVVAKKALPVLLSTQRKIYAPIDISLVFHSFPHLKTYVCLPRIVEQFNTDIPE